MFRLFQERDFTVSGAVSGSNRRRRPPAAKAHARCLGRGPCALGRALGVPRDKSARDQGLGGGREPVLIGFEGEEVVALVAQGLVRRDLRLRVPVFARWLNRIPR